VNYVPSNSNRILIGLHYAFDAMKHTIYTGTKHIVFDSIMHGSGKYAIFSRSIKKKRNYLPNQSSVGWVSK
jgi:hypothetical protein